MTYLRIFDMDSEGRLIFLSLQVKYFTKLFPQPKGPHSVKLFKNKILVIAVFILTVDARCLAASSGWLFHSDGLYPETMSQNKSFLH